MPEVIYLIDNISTDTKQFREIISHGSNQFPIQIYRNDFSQYFNHTIDWHWHPEVEFAFVISGKAVCYINDSKFEAGEGEGFFINSNTIHKEVPLNDTDPPILTTVCFLSDFIGDCGSDLIFRKSIQPVISDTSLKGMPLSPEIEWQKRILDILENMYFMKESDSWGFEFKCRNMISELWYQLALHLRHKPQNTFVSNKMIINENRIKKMLSFIHSNFNRELSVDEISKSANISKSECFRCFKIMIDQKPIAYLNEFRLKQAVQMLIETNMQITEICFACGFNHISYFGKLFRQYYGMSPKMFRKNHS